MLDRVANARDLFSVGEAVELTGQGELTVLRRRRGPRSAAKTGIVRGYGREPQIVRVQRDGQKVIEAYHVGFWQRRGTSNG